VTTWRLDQLRLDLDHPDGALRRAAASTLRIKPAGITDLTVVRRGYDARGAKVRFVYTVDVQLTAAAEARADRKRLREAPDETHRYPLHRTEPPAVRPVVIGTGPCGIFAGLGLAEMGFKPLLIERGKPVRARAADVWRFWRERSFDPKSNVQFGEGGAGTFSDGKLYSGVKNRKNRRTKVIETFVQAGAPPEIAWISKPHIGTLRLVSVVRNIRKRIIELGGEVRFETQVVDFDIADGRLTGLTLDDGTRVTASHVVLAVGHSARDTFTTLRDRGVPMERKPLSIGFRIEHPQSLIDRARLGEQAGHPELGAADYKLVHHAANGRSVYSFCMCPGGQVVAATSEEGRVVTNGMSHYSRAERNANAGLVVEVFPEDFPSDDPLAGVDFQRFWERRAFELGGGSYDAPAQRVGDFLAKRPSTELGAVEPSYTPGIHLTDLNTALPDFAIEALHEAIPALGRKLPGFDDPDALLTAVETRTSSPIRIPRGPDLQVPGVAGLFPAGEGAGYAGGILSAAVDGLRVADAVAEAIGAD
jgi:uncharacterized FAD-dependent dehydrogenase